MRVDFVGGRTNLVGELVVDLVGGVGEVGAFRGRVVRLFCVYAVVAGSGDEIDVHLLGD